jgi:hypothetical protein
MGILAVDVVATILAAGRAPGVVLAVGVDILDPFVMQVETAQQAFALAGLGSGHHVLLG